MGSIIHANESVLGRYHWYVDRYRFRLRRGLCRRVEDRLLLLRLIPHAHRFSGCRETMCLPMHQGRFGPRHYLG